MPPASQLPCPSLMRGRLFFCRFLLHNILMNVIQKILKDHYEIIQFDLSVILSFIQPAPPGIPMKRPLPCSLNCLTVPTGIYLTLDPFIVPAKSGQF